MFEQILRHMLASFCPMKNRNLNQSGRTWEEMFAMAHGIGFLLQGSTMKRTWV